MGSVGGPGITVGVAAGEAVGTSSTLCVAPAPPPDTQATRLLSPLHVTTPPALPGSAVGVDTALERSIRLPSSLTGDGVGIAVGMAAAVAVAAAVGEALADAGTGMSAAGT